ncbi:hypothetical protein Tco_0025539 [Tanacetum coccineum]
MLLFCSTKQKYTNKVKSGITTAYSTLHSFYFFNHVPEKEFFAGFADECNYSPSYCQTIRGLDLIFEDLFIRKQEGEFEWKAKHLLSFDKRSMNAMECTAKEHMRKEEERLHCSSNEDSTFDRDILLDNDLKWSRINHADSLEPAIEDSRDTLSVLGKFDGKSDEGFLVGYSLNSKAYRVYNLVTKRVEVNLHVNFLKDKPNVKGVGYRWMFNIDYLTDSMNYIPVSLENQANPHAGISEKTNNAGTLQTLKSIASEETDEEVELIVVASAVKTPEEKDESRKSSTNSKKEETLTEPQKEKKDSSTDSLEDNPKI